jgi:hypothetical protein
MRNWVAAFLVTLLVLVGLTLGARGVGLVSFKLFGSAEEATRREVFEQSKAYRDGMNQELRNMQAQYVTADDTGKTALRSIILHRVAGFPVEALQPDLAAFVNSLIREAVDP